MRKELQGVAERIAIKRRPASAPAGKAPSARGGSARTQRRRRALSTARDHEVEVVQRRMDDPWPDPQRDPLLPPQQVPVSFNRRVDLLEAERAHKRITQSQYETGLIVQAVYHRAGCKIGGGGWGGGDRVDQVIAHELAVLYKLADAETIKAYVERITAAIGPIDANILRLILAEGKGFDAVATLRGRGGERGTAYFAARFRDALEALAETWAAHGRPRFVQDERYSLDPLPEIRGERQAPAPGEAYDANGVQVPEGQGFKVANDPEAADRWRPAVKQKQIEAEAQRRLGRRR